MVTPTPLIYLDNAATSFPKPVEVSQAISQLLSTGAVSPGRSGIDLSLALGKRVDALRNQLGRLFANPAHDPNRTIFAHNATDAINLALAGLCQPGDHVIATVMDHNAVLRPLWMMQEKGLITFDLAPASSAGIVDPDELAKLIKPNTRLVVMTHASNICGALQPAAEVGAICQAHGVTFLLDVAQTAGAIEIDMVQLNCDLVAFTGHKSLCGPTGIGGLVIGPDVDVSSSRWGGTGVRSAQRSHLAEFPYRLEAGTLNTLGIVGLSASLAWLDKMGITTIGDQEASLMKQFRQELAEIKTVEVYGPSAEERQLPVLALNLRGQDPNTVGMFLDVDWNIAVRTGLHCAPLANDALGIGPMGSVRFSFGAFNTASQVEHALTALAAIATR